MTAIIKTIFSYGPLIFAFGFLAPLFAQLILHFGWTPPFGLSPLVAGLIVAGGYGLITQIRGRWI